MLLISEVPVNSPSATKPHRIGAFPREQDDIREVPVIKSEGRQIGVPERAQARGGKSA